MDVCGRLAAFFLTLSALVAGMVPNASAESMADSATLSDRRSPIVMAQASKAPSNLQIELDQLAKAARAEGEVTYYHVIADALHKRVSDAFTAKYGITHQAVRLPSNPIMQRYSTEAEAGTFAADFLIVAGGGQPFAEASIKKGWMEPVTQAGIPVIRSGEFPARFLTGATAVIQVAPLTIFYNTAKVKGADIPKDWSDLIQPKWKGQFLFADPRVSDAFYDVWTLILDKYGESYFDQLRAQQMRFYTSGPAITQALAAGEGSIAAVTNMQTVLSLKSKGAPIDAVIPDFTTGLEIQIMLTARGRSKHPNAARLFANYILSPEGNAILNDERGSISVYDTSGLPKQYQSPKAGAASRKAQINKLLGLE